MFPELRSKFADLKTRLFESDAPIALDLKSAADFGFDPAVANFYRKGFPGMFAALSGGMPAWSGESVSLNSALNHSVVYACNKIISETIGYLPATMMQQKGNQKIDAVGHPMYNAMKLAPNEEITAQNFTELLTSHCVLIGGGYAKINRRSGTGVALSLDPIQPGCVYPDREKTGQKRLIYVVKTEGEADRTYTIVSGKPQDILHLRGLGWDGITGYSVITLGRQSIGSAIASERNVARFWANGGRVPYVLETATKFKTSQDYDKWRAEWEIMVTEPHRAPILENGLQYKQTGLSMADAQMIETRQFSIPEICRWFGVSPHLVGDLSRATFSNIEQLALDFVKMTLAPWIGRWEQEFWRSVLTPEEKAEGYFLRLNVNALLRGDFKTRMEGYASALQNGHMNDDEVRELEDRNPLPNGAGQSYHFQMNMQTTPGTGEPTIVEQGILTRGSSARSTDIQNPK